MPRRWGDQQPGGPERQGDEGAGEYEDVAGFCKRATLDDLRKHGHVLTPGRYVGAEAAESDSEAAPANAM